MKFLVGLALCCAAIFVVSDATSAGAPIQACDNLTPGAPHGTTEQATPNPWMIDISSFDNGTGAYYYIPGYTYNVTLRRVDDTSSMTFRGFFIQGRTELTNMMVGAFNDPTSIANTRLSFCTTPAVGVTHSNSQQPRVEFSNPLTFKWVAPEAGTGPILFRYSVVQIQLTWWADDVSAVVQEGAAPDQPDQPTDPDSTDGALPLQGVGQWTLLMVTVITIALKVML